MSSAFKIAKTYKTLYIFSAFLLVLSGLIFGFSRVRSAFAETKDPDAGEISDMHYVTFFADNKTLTIKTNANTVEEALKRSNIAVENYDKVEPARTERINSDNYRINIYRAKPVTLSDGQKTVFLMTATTDEKALFKEAGFNVYDGDIVTKVAKHDILEAGLSTKYHLKHTGGHEVTVEEEIPYEEKTENDASMATGQTKLETMGEVGRKQSVYKINMVNNVEVSRELISTNIIKQPVVRVTKVGSKKSIPPDWETCANYARSAGVSENDLYVALTLIMRESGCRYDASNAGSGAYGIPQALPGSKMASAGGDWKTNPVTQIRWMIGYVTGRYGGWSQAWAFWSSHHWY